MFSRKQVAADFLDQYLPPDIRKLLDLDQLKLSKDSFTDPALDPHRSDLLYTVPYSETNLYLYFLFEHKSYPEELSGLQLLRYMVKIWSQLVKGQAPKKVGKLPPILPILVYHGKSPWTPAMKFHQLIDDPLDIFRDYTPDFKYELRDISHLDDDKIMGLELTKATLLLMKYIFRPDIVENLGTILALLRDSPHNDSTMDILETFLGYAIRASGQFNEKTLQDIVKTTFDGEDDIMQTFLGYQL